MTILEDLPELSEPASQIKRIFDFIVKSYNSADPPWSWLDDAAPHIKKLSLLNDQISKLISKHKLEKNIIDGFQESVHKDLKDNRFRKLYFVFYERYSGDFDCRTEWFDRREFNIGGVLDATVYY